MINGLKIYAGLGKAIESWRHRPWHRYGFAITVILLAAALRIWPLEGLENRLVWITFYPAVMAAALFGGFTAGIFATFLTILIGLFWSPSGEPFLVVKILKVL